jgi:two-component system, chemotaxis family, protein-glutamate methylesterase/glutaminase
MKACLVFVLTGCSYCCNKRKSYMAEPKYIIVIGASAGGLQAVTELMAQVTEEMDAAVFVVLHVSNYAYGDVVLQRLQRNSIFTCKMAGDNEPIRPKHFYLAVPDNHLILKDGKMILGRGPVENRWRPSIDVLFRSAAVAYTSRVIGVVLTGLLEDGASGMQAIKACGGTCIVQDPQEAEYPDMPQAVLRLVDVDYCTTLERIAIILQEKTKNGVGTSRGVPPRISKEAEIAERVAMGIETVENLDGERSPYSCPDCGGALWELKDDDITRYRCHTGHMYTAVELQEQKRKELENTFWVALRILEERRNLLNRMAEEEAGKGWASSARNKKGRAAELEEHIGRIKDILFHTTDDPEPTHLQLEGE